MQNVALDPNRPIVIIDASILLISLYFAILPPYLALKEAERVSKIKSLPSATFTEFMDKAKEITDAQKTDFSILTKDAKFARKFLMGVKRTVETMCKRTVKGYSYGNAILVKDCPRAQNWRVIQFPFYKAHRKANPQFHASVVDHFWSVVYPMLNKVTGIHVLAQDSIEADDVANLAKTTIRQMWPESAIWVVTKDHDYLQLADDRTKIVNLYGKPLPSQGNPLLDLSYKVLTGDSSDNIKPVFYGCGDSRAKAVIDAITANTSIDGTIVLTHPHLVTDAIIEIIYKIAIEPQHRPPYEKKASVALTVSKTKTLFKANEKDVKPPRVVKPRDPITRESIRENLATNQQLIIMNQIPQRFKTAFAHAFKFVALPSNTTRRSATVNGKTVKRASW